MDSLLAKTVVHVVGQVAFLVIGIWWYTRGKRTMEELQAGFWVSLWLFCVSFVPLLRMHEIPVKAIAFCVVASGILSWLMWYCPRAFFKWKAGNMRAATGRKE